MIRVLVNGADGRMGSQVVKAVYEDKDLEYSIEKNYLIIDLTCEYDKSAVTGYGFMLCGKEEDEQITVSTGDSLYFPYIIEINRREV